MRQTLRENNAAVVAPGARKPVSRFSLERAEARAVTIAHLSEPMHRADLYDAALLREFVDTELRLGLEEALEDEIINGDGTGEHFTGLSNVSGHQAQAWSSDLLSTTRAALTKLEVLSLVGSAFHRVARRLGAHRADQQRLGLRPGPGRGAGAGQPGRTAALGGAGRGVDVGRRGHRLPVRRRVG